MKFNTQKIVVFASGSGSNAEQIIQHFANQPNIRVAKIYVNNPQAFVIERAKKHHIKTKVFDRSYFLSDQGLISDLTQENPDLIVLAGFLWKIPETIVKAYPNQIINIHPALLPKFGGKGMFGMHVHRAVIATGESESGITIHYVNENYDEGAIIMQAKVFITPSDTPESLAQKIHKLEHQHYPVAIEKILTSS
jgi:phosphoribosylglycinamide formyltransferase-1